MKRRLLPYIVVIAAWSFLVAGPAWAQETEKKQNIGGVAAVLVKQIEGATGFKFNVAKSEGSLLSAITLRQISISDKKGVFARIGAIRLDWSPSGLLSANIVINELKVTDVALLRKPLSPPAEAKPFNLGVLDFNFPQPIDLQFKKLEIANIRIAAGVMGKAALAFNIRGQFFLPRSRKSALIALNLDRISGPGPEGKISAILVEDTGILTVDTKISEAPNGVVGNLLGLRAQDAITVTLQGKGPLNNWNGDFIADTGNVGRIGIKIGLRENGSRLLVDGDAASEMLSEKYAKLGKQLSFKLDLSWPGNNQIALNDLSVKSAIVDLSARGTLLPAENRLSLTVKGAFSDLSLLEDMTDLPIGGKGNVNLTINGTPTEPQMDLSLDATDARFERYRAKRMTITAKIQPKSGAPADGDGTKPGPNTTRIADLKIVAEGAQVDGPETARRLLESATIEVKGLFDTQTRSGRIEQLRVALDDATLTASGQLRRMDPLSFIGKFALKGSLKPDLLQGARLDDADIAGTTDIDMSTKSGKVVLKGSVGTLKTAMPQIDALLAGKVDLDIDASWKDKTLTARALKLRNDILSLSAQGVISQESAGTFTVALDAPSLVPFSGLAGVPLKGSMNLNADVKSSGKTIGGEVRLTAKALEAMGLKIGDARVRLTGPRFVNRPDVQLAAQLSGGRFDGTVALKAQETDTGDYVVSGLNVNAAGIRATGNARYIQSSKLIRGSMKAAIREIRRIAQPFGIPARGRLDLNLALRPTNAGTQSATVRALGRGLRYRDGRTVVSARRLRINARVGNVSTLSGITGTVTGQRIASGTTRVDTVNLRLRGGRRGASSFRLTTALRLAGKAIRASASGQAQISGNQSSVRLRALNVRYGTLPVRLLRGGVIRIAGANLTVTPHLLNVAGGRVRIALTKRGAGLRGQVNVTSMPASAARTAGFGPPLLGRLNANARIGGSTARPVIRFTAMAKDLRRVRAPKRAALSLGAKGALIGNTLTTDAEITSGDPKDRLNIKVRLAGRALRAGIKGQFGLGRLSDSGLVWRHRATGRLTADLEVTSTGAAPSANGRIAISGGRFVNAQTGAILNGIDLQLVGRGSRIQIVNGAATDGARGTINLSGYVDVNAARGYPVDIALRTDRAKLFRLDDAQIVVTSRLRVRGAVLRQIAASGDVTINSADIIIPDRLPASITVLDVIEINGRGKRGQRAKRAAAQRRQQASAALPVKLAINISAPRRFFIRGRGLDVEFGGNLALRGTSAKPAVAGQLNIVRGRLDLLGKRFAFQRGRIRFNNPNLANPSLFLIAEATTDDVKGIITISGTAQRPKFAVTSEPALPRDEVLARIMFGKKADELSTTESLRLAAGAVTLFGPGGAGVTDRIRRATGLDVIDVVSGPEGPRALAGKYISDKVLLKIEQGFGQDSSAVGVEVEVRKNVTVDTKFNSDGSGRVGIKWRKDY